MKKQSLRTYLVAAANRAKQQAAFNAQVAAGRTQHGVVRAVPANEHAAYAAQLLARDAARVAKSIPPDWKPPQQPERRVVQVPKPEPKPRTAKVREPKPKPPKRTLRSKRRSTREVIVAAIAAGPMSVPDMCRLAPGVSRDGVLFAMKAALRRGEIIRVAFGLYARPGTEVTTADAAARRRHDGSVRSRVMDAIGSEPMTAGQIRAAASDIPADQVRAAIRSSCQRGELERLPAPVGGRSEFLYRRAK